MKHKIWVIGIVILLIFIGFFEIPSLENEIAHASDITSTCIKDASVEYDKQTTNQRGSSNREFILRICKPSHDSRGDRGAENGDRRPGHEQELQ